MQGARPAAGIVYAVPRRGRQARVLRALDDASTARLGRLLRGAARRRSRPAANLVVVAHTTRWRASARLGASTAPTCADGRSARWPATTPCCSSPATRRQAGAADASPRAGC